MKIAILDGNNLAFKIFSRFKESRSGLLKNSLGIPTTVFFGFLRTLNLLVEKTKCDKTIICWDISGSYYRKKIFPLYKKHRKVLDMKEYYEELDSARKYFKRLGLNQATAKGIEADDLIGFLAYYFKDKKEKVIIVSDDKDYYQLVTSGIKIFRPIKNEFINELFVKEEYGMLPKFLPRIKALTGENTDFIPGVADIDEKNLKLIKKGLGEKTAIKILKNRKNLKDAIENCEFERWNDLLKLKRKQIFLSYKLSRIRTKKKQYLDWEQDLLLKALESLKEIKKPKVKTILRLMADLEIQSINIIFILKKLGIQLKGASADGGFKIKT